MSRRDTILNAWNGAWGDGDLAAFEQLLAPDYASLSKTIEAMHTAFPDSSTDILEIVEDGTKVAVHWQTTGTHLGEFMDVPPTGRSITVTGASFLRFDSDKLAEEYVVWDPRELLSALGIWHLGPGNA